MVVILVGNSEIDLWRKVTNLTCMMGDFSLDRRQSQFLNDFTRAHRVLNYHRLKELQPGYYIISNRIKLIAQAKL